MSLAYTQQGAVKRTSSHRVYLHFMLRHGWYVQFLEEDLQTPLRRKLTFANPNKIVEIQQRWGESRTAHDLSELTRAIETGRRSVWLILTTEQYQRLK